MERAWAPALALFLLVGLGLRLWAAVHEPWYWDEGYVNEAALSLAQGQWPSLGAMWQDGFFPLSTSMLPALSAAPFAALFKAQALLGARVWALLLQLLLIFFVAGFSRRLLGTLAGLAVAAAFALHPLAFQYGARAFYHHLPVLLLFMAVAPLENRTWRSGILAGLAVASAYWLWWAPFLLAWHWGAADWRQGARFLLYAGLSAGLLVGVNFIHDPSGALWSAKVLLSTSGQGSPRGPWEFIQGLGGILAFFPVLLAGLAGLSIQCFRDPKKWWLPTALAWACVLEPVRQRGNMSGGPYPYILSFPWIFLGLGALVQSGLRSRAAAWGLRALALAALAWPVNLNWMRAWSVEGPKAMEMADFLRSRGRQEDLVLGLPHFNWMFKGMLRTAEVSDVAAYEGRQAGYYPPGMPRSRFAHACALENVRFAVTSRVHVMGVYEAPGGGATFLKMEKEGWPALWQNKSFRIYENPRFGAKPDPKVRILDHEKFYAAAMEDARRGGLDSLIPLARARMIPIPVKP